MAAIFYGDDDRFSAGKSQYQTKFTVVDADTFGAARNYSNPCCLNFASHKRPGGGYEAVKDIRGKIRTQEEDLFRRSNLPELLDNAEVRGYYPLKGLGGFYTDGVVVNKDEYLNPCPAYLVSVVTIPAVVNPRPDQKRLVRAKAKRILEIAAHHKHKVLILGAWGCGVFNNDPEEIAGLFRSLLEGDFAGVFEEVVFAIPGAESSNHKLFEAVFAGGVIDEPEEEPKAKSPYKRDKKIRDEE